LQALNENNFNTRKLYPAKLSFKIDGTIKAFNDKQKLKQHTTIKPSLQKILQDTLQTESESKQNNERTGSTKPQKKRKYRLTLIELHKSNP
jgi:stress-induced morphogen